MADEDKPFNILNFFRYHYNGLFVVLIPLILSPIAIKWPTADGRCAFVVLVLLTYNVTQVLPLWVIGWISPVLVPCMGLLSSEDVSKHYFSEPISYMFGCYMIAIAFEVSGLHKRMAFTYLSLSDFSLWKIHLFVTVSTFCISIAFSNTATVALMCPVIKIILEEIHTEKIAVTELDPDPAIPDKKVLAPVGKALYIAMTYTATIGGTATMIGTASNPVIKHYYKQNFTLPGKEETLTDIKYVVWAIVPTIILVALIFVVLEITHFGMFRASSDVAVQTTQSAGITEAATRNIKAKYNDLGGWTFHQVMVLIFYSLLSVLLFLRSPGIFDGIAEKLPKKLITGTSFVIIIVLLLFLIPSNTSCFSHFSGPGPFPENTIGSLLPWSAVHKNYPWGLFFMLGSYLASVAAIHKSKLGLHVQEKLDDSDNLPFGKCLQMSLLITLVCTALVPNVATAHLLLPIFGRVVRIRPIAMKHKFHPLRLLLTTGMACNFSFLLPCGTTANAVVSEIANISSFFWVFNGIIPTILSGAITLVWSSAMFSTFFPNATN